MLGIRSNTDRHPVRLKIRPSQWFNGLAILVIAVLIVGLAARPATATGGPFSLIAASAQAGSEFGVPQEVILAVSYSETLWVDHGSAPSYSNGYGFMHLEDHSLNNGLQHAATLLGRQPVELRTDRLLNLRGGAALLREAYVATYPDDPGLSRASDLSRWYQPAAAYLQSPDKFATRNYADHVFALLTRGVSGRSGVEAIDLRPHEGLQADRGRWQDVPSDYELAALRRLTGLDMHDLGEVGGHMASLDADPLELGADQWVGSPNFGWQYVGQHGRPQALIEVVIHDCEGQYSGCMSTLQNNSVPLADRVSAHFLVRSSDGWRAQLVRVGDVAWHATFANNYAVGIEHEGFAAQGYAWYNATMYRQSSWLTTWACYLYYFGCDRSHIVAHSEIDSQKGDPGIYWDWNYYMTCVYWRLEYIQYQIQPQACY